MDKAESVDFNSAMDIQRKFGVGYSVASRIQEAVKAHAEEAVNDKAILTTNIIRKWNREEIEKFALHLLGDDWQSLKAQIEEERLINIKKYPWRSKIADLEQRLAEKEKEIERIKNNAIDLIGTQLCEKHQGEAKKSTFSEFQEKEKSCGCSWCNSDKIQDLERQLKDSEKVANAFRESWNDAEAKLKELQFKYSQETWKSNPEPFERIASLGVCLGEAEEIIRKLIRPETEEIYDASELYKTVQEAKQFLNRKEG